jgi:aryl-alcohol dehydrogenase-like predicted oxidoreductase
VTRLALGTARFGLDHYGVANVPGRLPDAEVSLILAAARAAGLDTLDTAVAYGDSEQRLGALGTGGWRVVTKIPAVPGGCDDVAAWLTSTIAASLERLRVPRLAAVLLHQPAQLTAAGGAEIYRALQAARAAGLTERIGLSVYDPGELDALFGNYRFDLVQAPLNIVDRRFAESGWLERLAGDGVEVHVRSVFLQGLLLMEQGRRPPYFDRWLPLWSAWRDWLQASGLRPEAACLRYVLSFPGVARAVVGVESRRQLEEILAAADGPLPRVPTAVACSDPDLVNPSRWTTRC